MAGYQNPKARIASLLGLSHVTPPSTPATISGGWDEVRSYAMPIARRRAENDIEISNEGSTRTTNRHITAAQMVVRDYGFQLVASRVGFDLYRRGK